MKIEMKLFAALVAVAALSLCLATGGFAETRASTPLVWKDLVLKHGWTGGGQGARVPAVAIDSNNIVHLRGIAVPPMSANTVFAKLPTAYRPAALVLVGLVGGSGALILGINTDGDISVFEGSPTGFVTLESISFPRDGEPPA